MLARVIVPGSGDGGPKGIAGPGVGGVTADIICSSEATPDLEANDIAVQILKGQVKMC